MSANRHFSLTSQVLATLDFLRRDLVLCPKLHIISTGYWAELGQLIFIELSRFTAGFGSTNTISMKEQEK